MLNPAESSLALEREILTPDTKLELVMAAYDDLEKYASEIKQVKSLEHVMSGTEFEGSGERKRVCLPFYRLT